MPKDIYTCKICEKQFNSSNALNGHKRSHTSYKTTPIICCSIYSKKELAIHNLEQHNVAYLKKLKKCPQCGTNYINLRFCSKSCMAIYTNMERNKRGWKPSKSAIEQIKKTLKATRIKDGNAHPDRLSPFPYTRIYHHKCIECDDTFSTHRKNKKCCYTQCAKKAQQTGGKKSASIKTNRSKDEIMLFEMCKNHFNNVDHNKIIKDGWDADIIINDTKTLIFWNGPWHYKEMPGLKHSLIQVQTRDKIKTKLFTKLGWNIIVYEDRYYTPQQAFDELVAIG